MNIVWAKKIDMAEHGIDTSCNVYAALVIVNDIDKRAKEMIETISDKSWIKSLPSIPRASFEAASKRTIDKLVRNIHNRVEGDALTSDFGEYMISDTALCVLEEGYTHKKLPLAEILKGRVTGNEGFDFHSECTKHTVSFGEAKYSGVTNPYNRALKQINDFVVLEKDIAELNTLQNFISPLAAKNATKGIKSYAAAFSINAANPEKIMKNVLRSTHLPDLLNHACLYIIGIEVNDSAFN